MKLRLSLLAGLLGASTALVVTSAGAAPAPSCTPATMTPRAATVPVNLPGFAYTALAATTNDVHLFATDSPTELALTVGPVADGLMKVTPVSPLIAGKSYRLEFAPFCSYGPVQPAGPLTFTAAAAVPLPTKVGGSLAAPTVTLRDFGTTAFTIATSTALDPEMKAWLPIYQLVLVLDGKVVSTRTTLTANDDVQIIADGWCDTTLASTKTHTIQLRGRLPFAPTIDTLATETVFDCPAPTIGTPPNNPPTAPPPGTTPGTSGQPASPTVGNRTSTGGCSVTASDRGTTSLPLLGIALGVMAFVRRRARGPASRRV